MPQQLITNQHLVHITYSLLATPYTRFELSFLPRPWLWNAPNTPQCWYVSTAKGATLLAARETCRHMVATPYANAHIGDAAAEPGRRRAERSCQTSGEVEHRDCGLVTGTTTEPLGCRGVDSGSQDGEYRNADDWRNHTRTDCASSQDATSKAQI